MKIYHGSLEIVEKPEIRIPNRTLDYGYGFYTTTSYEQAFSWVRRKLDKIHNKGFINIYDFDENNIKNLKVLNFEQPTEEWVDFVMKNRTQKEFIHNYDLVFGPVANDKTMPVISLYFAGVYSEEDTIKRLLPQKLQDQFVFKTEKSLKQLNYVETIEK